MTGGRHSMTGGSAAWRVARALQRASQHLNVVRHLWRLSHECKAMSLRAHGDELLAQPGRQFDGNGLNKPLDSGLRRNDKMAVVTP